MTQKEMFGNAQWITIGNGKSSSEDGKNEVCFPITRSKIYVIGQIETAELRVVGLGTFYGYINAKPITQERFLPLSTDFESRKNFPTFETLTGHRMYVPKMDVASLLQQGENTFALHFGGGWYTFSEGRYGDAKAIWYLQITYKDGKIEEFYSSTKDKIHTSFVYNYYFTRFEHQDARMLDFEAFCNDFDDSDWQKATLAKPVATNYAFSSLSGDVVDECIQPELIATFDDQKVYDIRKNCSAYPILMDNAKAGEEIVVTFSEEKNDDNRLDMKFNHEQSFKYISDGKGRVFYPRFTWFAFRYMSVKGQATIKEVVYIHAPLTKTSAFTSSNKVLNWLYDAYITTQLSNMHSGIPSDCPHIERRGYTGDGQLTAKTAMTVFDGQEFYKKWIEDISDCQAIETGHVQYCAPFMHCGGGPGGWGCAMVEVPYRYYKFYGDKEILSRLYPQMLNYFEYLEAHSKNNLVVSDKEGHWCLGDWSTPKMVILPAPFVNNYFYIKSLQQVIEIAKIIGKEKDIPMFQKRIVERKEALQYAYFNSWDGNFFGGEQGANAFAVDIGLGDERTYKNLVDYYKKLGHFDTGIFGTDILIRVLYERGDGALATSLLMSEHDWSFGGFMNRGATTIAEEWNKGRRDRSHSHPMFGAVVAYIFEFLLGITQSKESCNYEDLIISPHPHSALDSYAGYQTISKGKIEVACEKKEGKYSFVITLPKGVHAKFIYNAQEKYLHDGRNVCEVEILS